jgi:hypothetical protein
VSAEAWIAAVAMLAGAAACVAAGNALHFSRESARAATRSAKAAEQQTEIARRAERSAVRAARAAEEQTELQRQIRIDAAQPYVWADLQPDDAQGSLVRLVVGNSGPTIATNVRVEIDPPLQAIPGMEERAEAATRALATGFRSLGPGRVHAWSLGMAWDLIRTDGPVHTFTVYADGPFGPVPPLSYVVDLSQWQQTTSAGPSGSDLLGGFFSHGVGSGASGDYR